MKIFKTFDFFCFFPIVGFGLGFSICFHTILPFLDLRGLLCLRVGWSLLSLVLLHINVILKYMNSVISKLLPKNPLIFDSWKFILSF
jgi:hypothetical protein